MQSACRAPTLCPSRRASPEYSRHTWRPDRPSDSRPGRPSEAIAAAHRQVVAHTWAVGEERRTRPAVAGSPGCSPAGSPAVDSSHPGCCSPGCILPAVGSLAVGSPGRSIRRSVAGFRRWVGVLLVPVLERNMVACHLAWSPLVQLLTPYLSLIMWVSSGGQECTLELASGNVVS